MIYYYRYIQSIITNKCLVFYFCITIGFNDLPHFLFFNIEHSFML